jgi:predicted kinase
MKPILNILIGIPGSGKTTYAKKHLLDDKTVYLSSDDIRLELFGYENQNNNELVFNTMQKRAKEALKSGLNVVYDATNLSRKKRKTIIDIGKRYSAVYAYMFCCSIGTLLERNMTRQERRLPWDKLEMMIKSLDIPFMYEGFDYITYINNGCEKEFNIFEDFKQNNPHHGETLGEHCKEIDDYILKKYAGYGLTIEETALLMDVSCWHDCGKPYCKEYSEEKGHDTYYNHEKLSAYLYLCYIGSSYSKGMFSTSFANDEILLLIAHHMDFWKANLKTTKELLGGRLFRLLEIFHEADIYREE